MLVGVVVLVVLLEVAPLLLGPVTVTLETFQVVPFMVRSVTIWSASAAGEVILLFM